VTRRGILANFGHQVIVPVRGTTQGLGVTLPAAQREAITATLTL
jgi:hypothetical protein